MIYIDSHDCSTQESLINIKYTKSPFSFAKSGSYMSRK